MYHLLETQLYMIPLWEWAKFTLPNWIFHPLLFSFPYFPTWFLFYSFTWLPFLEPVLGNSTYNSNPLHILPCIHIICHMYGLHGSLWLSILFSSNSVTWCSPANMPSILYAFILSLLPVLLCFFCCYFSVFFSFFAYHQCTFQEWTLRFPKKKKKKRVNPSRHLSSSGRVPGVLGTMGSADGPALTPRTPGLPVHLRPMPCASGSSGSPTLCTSKAVPGIWMSVSMRDHYFTCHMPCGWQSFGAPAGCQAWASEVGELRSGHWTTRDLLAPRNINQQELSQRSPSQC